MDIKFDKKSSESGSEEKPQEKGRQTGLLVLLLVLLGGFGYIYFFTGLIRPQTAPPPPPAPPQVLKQPLPARDAAPQTASNPADSKVQPPSVAAKQPAIPAAKEPQKAPETKPAAPVLKPPVSQAVPPKAAALPEQKKPAAQKKPDAVKQAAVPPAKKAELPKPLAAGSKPEEKKAVVSAAQQSPAKAASARTKKPVVKGTGPWTVVAGLYLVEETLAADMSKIRKAGLTPVMTSGKKQPVTMYRLFMAEFADRPAADQALEKLHNSAGGGFVIQHASKFDVYAGSYAVMSGAQSEQKRLSDSGIKVQIRKAQVMLPSRKLTAGIFTDRKDADDALKKLKAAGIAASTLE
jgi:hypothetical protein